MIRAVLVVPRSGTTSPQTKAALDLLDLLGYTLVAVVDPDAYRQAHQLIGAGEADIIVHTGDLPSVRLAAPHAARRTAPVLRPAEIRNGLADSPRQARRTERIARAG